MHAGSVGKREVREREEGRAEGQEGAGRCSNAPLAGRTISGAEISLCRNTGELSTTFATLSQISKPRKSDLCLDVSQPPV
jgi:hypothetical protein